MCQSGATCLPAENPTQRVSPEQSGHHHYVIECNLLSPWYSWKIAELALSNTHSLTHLRKLAYRVYPLSLTSVKMNL